MIFASKSMIASSKKPSLGAFFPGARVCAQHHPQRVQTRGRPPPSLAPVSRKEMFTPQRCSEPPQIICASSKIALGVFRLFRGLPSFVFVAAFPALRPSRLCGEMHHPATHAAPPLGTRHLSINPSIHCSVCPHVGRRRAPVTLKIPFAREALPMAKQCGANQAGSSILTTLTPK